jgi:hypothetical protein
VLCGAWLSTWVDAMPVAGDPVARPESGAQRTGATAALATLAAAGLAATALVASTRRGFAIGAALTDAAVATLSTVLVATSHPWVPGPDAARAWSPIFGPLAVLALLDAFVRWRRVPVSREVVAIRAFAALVAGAALAATLVALPAGVALWLGLSPLSTTLATTPRAARRVVEGASGVAALVLVAAPEIAQAAAPPSSTPVGAPALATLLYRVVAVGLVVVAAFGTFRPDD